jgi:hemerythrin-like domain-containing protein
MYASRRSNRREFVTAAAAAAGGLLVGCAEFGRRPEAAGEPEGGVSPAEDLMREHGVLRRVMFVYAEASRRLEAGAELPVATVAEAAGIVRAFVEDYHEKLEEDFLFPRFRRADKLVDLVDVLLEQHHAGRRLTDTTLRLAALSQLQAPADRALLRDSMQQLIRMYGPHAAREDTVLFPALHQTVSPSEYADLGEQFEDKERELFGEGGFEKMVERVAAVERVLGIYDLRQFTPGP